MAMAPVLAGFAVIIFTLWLYRLVAPRVLYPRVLPGLPHNHHNARRLFGDMPDLGALVTKTGCTQSEAVFEAVVQRGPAQSPIVQLLTPCFMPQAIVLVDDPREVEDILRRRGKEFDRSAMTAAFFEPLLPRASIVQFTTLALKAQKKLWAEAVSPDFVRKVAVPHARQSALRLVDIWRLKAAVAAGEGDGDSNHTFEAIPDFLDATMDLMWALVLGSDLGVLSSKLSLLKNGKNLEEEDDDDHYASGWTSGNNDLGLSKAAESSRNMFFQVTSFLEHESSYIRSGWAGWRLKFIKFTPRYRRVRREMESEMRKLVADARSKFLCVARDGQTDDDDASARCAMDSVLRREALAARKEGVVHATNIEQELMLFMIAGIDSTAYTIAWCVKFLSRYTNIQAELRQSLRSAYAGASLPSADEIATKTVPYLDAFLHETLRFSVTAGSVNRRVTVDTQILGYRVAAGTELVLNTRVLRRPIPCHESLRSASSHEAQEKRARGGIEGPSGDELEKFNPRRWLYRQEDGTEAFDPEALPTLVFSHGVRGCFGKRLAMHDLRVFVVILVLCFEFLPVSSKGADDWTAEEAIFRYPKHAAVKLRTL